MRPRPHQAVRVPQDGRVAHGVCAVGATGQAGHDGRAHGRDEIGDGVAGAGDAGGADDARGEGWLGDAVEGRFEDIFLKRGRLDEGGFCWGGGGVIPLLQRCMRSPTFMMMASFRGGAAMKSPGWWGFSTFGSVQPKRGEEGGSSSTRADTLTSSPPQSS